MKIHVDGQGGILGFVKSKKANETVVETFYLILEEKEISMMAAPLPEAPGGHFFQGIEDHADGILSVMHRSGDDIREI